MLMSVADIEARAGQTYDDDQIDQVNAFIDDITALVEDFLDRSFETAAPPRGVRAIACREVLRLLNTTPGIVNERVGDLSTGYGGMDATLSDLAIKQLRRYRLGGGIRSIQLISNLVPPPPEEDDDDP